MSEAHPNTLRPATMRRIARMRILCSSIGIPTARVMAAVNPSTSYGLIINASRSSSAAPASSLSTSTPRSSSREATNSFATKFMPSASELTTQKSAIL